MSFATTLAATAATAAAAAAAAAAVAVTTAAAAAIMQESPQSDFNGETINKEGSRSALDAPPPAPVSMSYVRRSRTTAIRIPPPPSSLWIPGHDCLEIFDFISDSTLIKFHTLVTSHKPTHGMSVDDLLSNLDFQAELKVWFIEARQVIEVWEQQVPGPEADAEQFVRMWRALSNIDNCGDYSDEEEHSSIKGIINVNIASAAPASSTAAAAAAATATATAAAASPAAGASSLYSINTHGPPVDEGKESAPNDTTITKSLNSVKECISPSSSNSDQEFVGILVSGKCDYESGCCGSNSFLVGASKQQAASFREAYGRSGSEDDNASGGAGMIHLVTTAAILLAVTHLATTLAARKRLLPPRASST